jgi:hypothetical protein
LEQAKTRKIRLPLSRATRSQPTWAKLLNRIDPRSRSPFTWHGRFFQPGTWIEESDLWPDGTFPRIPLLVEHAGAATPAKGHNRHRCDNTVILWRYDRDQGKFLEVGRVAAPAGIWMMLLEPLVREWLRPDADNAAAPDLDLIRSRITAFLSAELNLISDPERARVLTLVHDELAARLAEWGLGESWLVGSSSQSQEQRTPKPTN